MRLSVCLSVCLSVDCISVRVSGCCDWEVVSDSIPPELELDVFPAVRVWNACRRVVSELTVPVPWGQIRGKVWGPDHGRRVVCLHGWADNCGTFDTLLPLLPQGNALHAGAFSEGKLVNNQPNWVQWILYLSLIPQIINMWRLTCPVMVSHPIALLESRTIFNHMWLISIDLLKVCEVNSWRPKI